MEIIPDVKYILSQLYDDLATVYRYETVITDYKTTETVLTAVPALKNIPCRLSFKNRDDPQPLEDANPIKIRPLLFCGPDIEIKSGDYVEVVRHGKIYRGRLGDPVQYKNSLQVEVVLEGDS